MYFWSVNPVCVYLHRGKSENSGVMPPGGVYVVPWAGVISTMRAFNVADSASSRFDELIRLDCLEGALGLPWPPLRRSGPGRCFGMVRVPEN